MDPNRSDCSQCCVQLSSDAVFGDSKSYIQSQTLDCFAETQEKDGTDE